MVAAVGKSLGGPWKPAEKGGGCRRHRQDAEESRVPSRTAAPWGRRSDMASQSIRPRKQVPRRKQRTVAHPQPALFSAPRRVMRVNGSSLRKALPVFVRSSGPSPPQPAGQRAGRTPRASRPLPPGILHGRIQPDGFSPRPPRQASRRRPARLRMHDPAVGGEVTVCLSAAGSPYGPHASGLTSSKVS